MDNQEKSHSPALCRLEPHLEKEKTAVAAVGATLKPRTALRAATHAPKR